MPNIPAVRDGFIERCITLGITKEATLSELWDKAKGALAGLSPLQMGLLTGGAGGLGTYGLSSLMGRRDPLQDALIGAGISGAAGGFGKSYYNALHKPKQVKPPEQVKPEFTPEQTKLFTQKAKDSTMRIPPNQLSAWRKWFKKHPKTHITTEEELRKQHRLPKNLHRVPSTLPPLLENLNKSVEENTKPFDPLKELFSKFKNRHATDK